MEEPFANGGEDTSAPQNLSGMVTSEIRNCFQDLTNRMERLSGRAL